MSEFVEALVENLTIDEVNHVAARASDIRKEVYIAYGFKLPERDLSAGDVRCVLTAFSELP